MSFDVAAHTIFVGLAGSRAHGTDRAGSDVDLRGVCRAPLADRLSLFATFEQLEGPAPAGLSVVPRWPPETKTECVIFELAKFLRLCAEANPSMLEILFLREADWLFAGEPWRRIHAVRERFLTARIHDTFLGYASAQLKKIRTHRARIGQPPRPERSPRRAALEAQYGYDTKHAMHVVRLLRMAVEILERGEVVVLRPDAAELAAIRDGALVFDAFVDLTARLEEAALVAARTARLPPRVERAFVDELYLSLVMDG